MDARGLATLSLAACFGDRDKTLALYGHVGSSADQLCLYLNLCFDYVVKFFFIRIDSKKGKRKAYLLMPALGSLDPGQLA